ncbi:MAG: 5-formaminoimidazole-4-carboxamide-1-(beta)-D-ribofuranosyl 5'-monophosphate synthetase [Candidatus Nealsonbacteria bacterium CG08_land_8_20_14_0_20_38_20]|uniref:5-formaminoimidazole-4-carboxamide-1-(Beta)-D-ribofuranosyl 5'-monophosphate synthetase n=1 Tax=Candidatus Nealsonbacteria bacterium CG08_land_8_20_14_0_20_38_20 TaxID=1974705 RepID=A0A2H0YM09_9BACT|nr:MAG: 5-formaminoimidazole-4-carboxamide-1-(beta)-D-ribofuranosyl 5'-monophosphate synthetase [Candidatus Nealsonbacteria bacterium CG08_land_8_20_14_0_20_38_20]
MDISKVIQQYNKKNLTIGVIGSHSALDICAGAKKFGLKNLVVCEKGREKTYNFYYKAKLPDEGFGCVDEALVLEKFKDILREENQEILRQKNVLFVPHRSFEVYLDFDYKAIEEDFAVPIFGNRFLLKIEERGVSPNQYDLLYEAGIKTAKIFASPEDIDRPAIVKVLEKERGFERAFFLASSPEEYRQKSDVLLKKGIISKTALAKSVIEEFILGVPVNLNYFYSPVFERLEFLGSDTRRQTNLDGFLRLPSGMQKEAEKDSRLTLEEAGHIAVTMLESLLEQVYEIGEKFVEASKKFYPPGVIGPFALQTCIIPGPPKKEFITFDVSPRVPGSPGIKWTPYSSYLFGKNLSVGERIGKEIREMNKNSHLSKIIT